MKTKRRIALLLTLVLVLVTMLPVTAKASTGKINVVINGKPAAIDPAPIMVKGRVLVPIRPVAEAVGAEVSWDKDLGRIEVSRGFRTIELWVPTVPNEEPRDWAWINGRYTDLDVPPVVIKGRTFVPLRLIAEGLGGEVGWDKGTYTVSIDIPEIKALEGLSAGVRDAVYNTLKAKSFRYNLDVQYKDPDYPQLNLIKLKGDKDKDGNISGTGHIFGWTLDAFTVGNEVYAKNALFNNSWVSLREFHQDADDFKDLIFEEAMPYMDNSYEYLTEVIRALGEPKVAAEETVGNTLCQKIVFTPNVDTANAFLQLRYMYEDLTGGSLVLWVGKSDNLVHKFDLRVDYTDFDYETEQEEPGFAHVTMELSDINQDFKVQIPADYKKQ